MIRAFTFILMILGIVLSVGYVITYVLVYREFKKLPAMMKFRLSKTVKPKILLYAFYR